MRITKDPLVALSEGSADAFLGVSYLVVAGRCIETPTYFTLEREHPIDYVPLDNRPFASVDPSRLTRVERGWAEALMAAIIATGGEDGLPSFASIDRTTFWQSFEEAPAPLVRAGLRPMVHALTFLPIVSGFGRPFFMLPPQERARFLAKASDHPGYFVRQALVTLKTLACFAYFDDPRVRANYDAAPIPGTSP